MGRGGHRQEWVARVLGARGALLPVHACVSSDVPAREPLPPLPALLWPPHAISQLRSTPIFTVIQGSGSVPLRQMDTLSCQPLCSGAGSPIWLCLGWRESTGGLGRGEKGEGRGPRWGSRSQVLARTVWWSVLRVAQGSSRGSLPPSRGGSGPVVPATPEGLRQPLFSYKPCFLGGSL